MSWIKLLIHPEHEKVLRLADLTGATPDAAFIAAVRWFRWVDAHVENADTSISTLSFRAVARWSDDSLSSAMLHKDVEWLVKGRDGMLRPSRPDSHFSASAKKRAVHAKQVAHKRAQSCAQSEQLDQTRPDQIGWLDQNQRAGDSTVSIPVGRVVEEAEVRKMVRALGLNPLTESRVLALTDLTGAEINEVVASVRATPGIKSVPAVVANEILRRRGISLGKKAAGSLSVAAMANTDALAGIENLRKIRRPA